jgi:hypothetical protein
MATAVLLFYHFNRWWKFVVGLAMKRSAGGVNVPLAG